PARMGGDLRIPCSIGPRRRQGRRRLSRVAPQSPERPGRTLRPPPHDAPGRPRGGPPAPPPDRAPDHPPRVESALMEVIKPGPDRDVPRGVVGGSEISQSTAGARNIYMGVFRVPPGAQSRPHYHENCESVVYML